jgi:hypothetical protein
MLLTPEEIQTFAEQNKDFSVPQNDFLTQVSRMPREQAAKIMRLSVSTGMDITEAARNPNAAVQALIGASDLEDVGKNSPKTRSFLSDPLRMAIVRDAPSVKTLSTLEALASPGAFLKSGAQKVGKSLVDAARGVVETATENEREILANSSPADQTLYNAAKRFSFLGAITGDEKVRFLKQLSESDALTPTEYQFQGQKFSILGQEYDTAQLVSHIYEGVPQLASQVAAWSVGGPVGAGAMMGAQIFGGSYDEMRKEGVAPGRAFTGSAANAVAQAALENVALGKILNRIPAGSTAKKKALTIFDAAATEAATEFLQQYPDAVSKIWAGNPDMTVSQQKDEFVRQFRQITSEAIYSGLVAAPLGGGASSIHVAVQSQMAKAHVDQLRQRQEVIAQSPLLKISPEIVEQFENGNGEPVVYIDPKALFQSAVPDLTEKLGVTQEQVQTALETGHMIEVPTGKYNVAASQEPAIHEALAEDIAATDEGYTIRRLQERSQQDVLKTAAEINRRDSDVRTEADAIYKQWTDNGLPTDVARMGLIALVKNAYVMSDNPAQYLREKAPQLRQGEIPADAMKQYAGFSAYTADQTQLAKAQELESQGTSREEIRKQTGWFKGMDGKWRFEIDDSQAALIDLKGMEQSMTGEISGILSKAKKMKDTSARSELESQADTMLAQLSRKKAPLLGNVLDHPTLYKAYPWMKDVKVVFVKLPAGTNGSYDQSINTIEINIELPPEQRRIVLLHEVQHVIQAQEDFARGGNPDMFSPLDVTAKEISKIDKELKDILDGNKEYAALYREFNQLYVFSKARELTVDEENRQYQLAEQMAEYEDLELKTFNLELQRYKLLDERKVMSPVEQYRNLAGEIEARDTAGRAALTGEQRQIVPPDLRGDAIVYFQDKNDPKGAIHWEEGRAIITLFEQSDPSTLVHEMVGHFFMQNLLEVGAQENAPAWMKKDRQTALDFVGLTGERWTEAAALAAQGTNEEWAMTDELLAADGERAEIRRAILDHRTAHEKLARAAEAYIMEGKAPSIETRSLFKRFAEWLTEVYRDIINLRVKINPEIREVFDRLLASQEEIDQLQAVDGYLARIPDDVYNSLSDQAKADLDRQLERTRERAEAQVRAHLLKEFTAENRQKIAEEEEEARVRITAEVKGQPLYLAEAAIRETFKRDAKRVAKSYLGNESFVPEDFESAMGPLDTLEAIHASLVQRGRGDTAEAQEMDRQISELRKKKSGKVKELTPDQAVEFELIAELHGFTSGSELAQNVITYNTSEKTIENRLDDHMTAFKDSLTDSIALHKEVQEAMYSDESAMLIAAEQAIIEEKLGRVISRENSRKEMRLKREAAKAAAQEAIADMPLDKAMRLATWMSGERRAAESKTKALRDGNLQAAREHAAAQLYNHAMVQESLRVRRDFERIERFMKKQRSSGRDTWVADELDKEGLAIKSDRHFIQAADLLRRAGYVRKDYNIAAKQESLSGYVAAMTKDNPDMVDIPEWLVNSVEEYMNPRYLKYQEFKDLEIALRNIKQMAKNGVNADGFVALNKDGLGATVMRMVHATIPLKDVLPEQIEQANPSFVDKFTKGLTRPAQLFLKLDSYKEFGEWSKAMYYSLSDALSFESRLKRQVYEAIDAGYESVGISKQQRLLDAHKKIYISEWGQSVTKNTLRAVLLNMGSASNKKRLISSRPFGLDYNSVWNEGSVKAVLVKYLDPKDFQLAQQIWDAINILYDPYTNMIQRMTGSPLAKVEAVPLSFIMRDGSEVYLRGGYYPLKQDPRASKQAELNRERSLAEGYIGVMPYPRTGASKSREAGAKFAVDLDLTNIFSHVNDVSHDIAFRPIMHDINKVMRRGEVNDVLRRKLGEAGYKVITEWQRAMGSGKDQVVEGMFNDFSTFVRSATVIKNLLFRPATIIQNMANPTLYGDSVKGFSDKDALDAYWKYGWGEYIPHALRNTAKAQEIRDWVYAKSALMRDKMESPDYNIRELREARYGNPLLWAQERENISEPVKEAMLGPGAKIAITQEKLIDFGSGMLAWADQLSDIPMFKGAYEKAIAEGKMEKEAVHFAETIIERSTGSGRRVDTSLMQRGSPTEKLLTLFMTFMNTQYNRWVMEKGIYQTEKDAMRMIKFVGVRYLLFGALSALLSGKWPDDDDEKDGWGKWFFKEVAAWPLGMIPVGGAMAKTVLDTALGYRTFGFGITPAERNLDEMIKIYGVGKRYAEGKAGIADLLESGSSIAAFGLRYPDQFNDWFWNAYDVLANDMDPRLSDLKSRRPRRERQE